MSDPRIPPGTIVTLHRRKDDWHGTVQEIEDTYSFGPVLGDEPLQRVAWGEPYAVLETLGSRPYTFDGVPGVRFAVWAPNATYVSVIGDRVGGVCRHRDGTQSHQRRLRDRIFWAILRHDHHPVVCRDAAQGLGAPGWMVFGQSQRRLATVVVFAGVHDSVGFLCVGRLTLPTRLPRWNEESIPFKRGISPGWKRAGRGLQPQGPRPKPPKSQRPLESHRPRSPTPPEAPPVGANRLDGTIGPPITGTVAPSTRLLPARVPGPGATRRTVASPTPGPYVLNGAIEYPIGTQWRH